MVVRCVFFGIGGGGGGYTKESDVRSVKSLASEEACRSR